MRFLYIFCFLMITCDLTQGGRLTDLEIVGLAIELSKGMRSSNSYLRGKLFPFIGALGCDHVDTPETQLRQKLIAYRYKYGETSKTKCIEFLKKGERCDVIDSLQKYRPIKEKGKFKQVFENLESQQPLTESYISHISPRLADSDGLSGSVVELVLKLDMPLDEVDKAKGWQFKDHEKVQGLLNRWRTSCPVYATKEVLKAGLTDIGRGDVIGKLEELPGKL